MYAWVEWSMALKKSLRHVVTLTEDMLLPGVSIPLRSDT
jgi:hypothetical protein